MRNSAPVHDIQWISVLHGPKWNVDMRRISDIIHMPLRAIHTECFLSNRRNFLFDKKHSFQVPLSHLPILFPTTSTLIALIMTILLSTVSARLFHPTLLPAISTRMFFRVFLLLLPRFFSVLFLAIPALLPPLLFAWCNQTIPVKTD